MGNFRSLGYVFDRNCKIPILPFSLFMLLGCEVNSLLKPCSHHDFSVTGPKSESQDWIDTSKTVSWKKPLLFLNCISQTACYSNRKLATTKGKQHIELSRLQYLISLFLKLHENHLHFYIPTENASLNSERLNVSCWKWEAFQSCYFNHFYGLH